MYKLAALKMTGNVKRDDMNYSVCTRIVKRGAEMVIKTKQQ